MLLNKKELIDRWESDPKYVEFADLLRILLDTQEERFLKKNQEVCKKLVECVPAEWVKYVSPSIYTDYLDLTEYVDKCIGKCLASESGEIFYDMRGYVLQQQPFAGIVLRNTDLSYMSKEGTTGFQFSRFINCVFDHANLQGCDMGHYYEKCLFRRTDFRRVFWRFNFFHACDFESCIFGMGRYGGGFLIHVKDSTFVKCNLRGMSFGASAFQNTTFVDCDLRKAHLQGVDVKYANCRFIGCDFTDVYKGYIPPGVE